MSERELFEQRFPVPAGIYWNEISEQYDALPGAAGFDDVEIYHGKWQAWQAARAQGGQEVEAVAWVSPLPDGTEQVTKEFPERIYGVVPKDYQWYVRPLVYGDTHPQPAQQSNQEDVVALLTNALANIRDTDASAKTLQSMAALALRVTNELATTHQPAQQGSVPDGFSEFVSAVRSINRSSHHAIQIPGDDEPCFWQRKEWIDWILELADQVEHSLSAATPQPQGDGWIPEGWKLVPIEPTPDMRRAFHEAHELFEDGEEVDGSPDDEWRAMLDAAPQPPVEHCNAQLQENSK